jgi:hypothetical protein
VQELVGWRIAAEMLIAAAEGQRPVMFAEIAVRQALHAGEPASTPTPRRTPARTQATSAGSCGMNLYLRKVVHSQAHDNYRVILKRGGDEVEIGSIGIQHGAAWAWGIDTVIPMRDHETQGEGSDRRDCMRRFKGGLGAVCRRRGQPGRVPEREAAAVLVE